MIIDISIAPIEICSKRFTKVIELKRKFYEIKIQSIVMKRNVFSLRLKRFKSSHERISLGSLFQSSGAETEKALDP